VSTSAFQAAKLELVSFLGLSKDALHVHVGLLVFVMALVISKKPLRSIAPLAVVFLAASLGEALDARDDIADLGYWRVAASAHDILNTVFWPTAFVALARYTRVFG